MLGHVGSFADRAVGGFALSSCQPERAHREFLEVVFLLLFQPQPRLRLRPRLEGGNYREFFAVVFLSRPRSGLRFS